MTLYLGYLVFYLAGILSMKKALCHPYQISPNFFDLLATIEYYLNVSYSFILQTRPVLQLSARGREGRDARGSAALAGAPEVPRPDQLLHQAAPPDGLRQQPGAEGTQVGGGMLNCHQLMFIQNSHNLLELR